MSRRWSPGFGPIVVRETADPVPAREARETLVLIALAAAAFLGGVVLLSWLLG